MDASAGAGSGNASGAGASACCYYTLLGIRKNASSTDIRAAYRRLALKWHPDRWTSDPGAAGEAKRRFQRIQEAYAVLSDKGKRAMYDARLYDPLDDNDQDFSDFMQEMLVMMDSVKNELNILSDAFLAIPFVAEAGHARRPAEDAGRHSQRRRREPRRRRSRAVGRHPEDARRPLPAAAQVIDAPVYETCTPRYAFSERGKSKGASNGKPIKKIGRIYCL